MCMTKKESTLRSTVRQGYAMGLPVAEIAVRAGSTPGAVRVTAWRLGLRHPRQGRPKSVNLRP